MQTIRIGAETLYRLGMDWHDRYLDGARPDDERVRRVVLRRKCADCSKPFLVAPNRPDADHCGRPACRSRRQRERERARK